MKSINDVKQRLLEIKPELQKEFKVRDIGVFGSYATGQNHPDSDLDLIVSFSGPVGWKFFDLKDHLEEKLGVSIDLVTKDSIKKRLRKKIIDQANYV